MLEPLYECVWNYLFYNSKGSTPTPGVVIWYIWWHYKYTFSLVKHIHGNILIKNIICTRNLRWNSNPLTSPSQCLPIECCKPYKYDTEYTATNQIHNINLTSSLKHLKVVKMPSHSILEYHTGGKIVHKWHTTFCTYIQVYVLTVVTSTEGIYSPAHGQPEWPQLSCKTTTGGKGQYWCAKQGNDCCSGMPHL